MRVRYLSVAAAFIVAACAALTAIMVPAYGKHGVFVILIAALLGLGQLLVLRIRVREAFRRHDSEVQRYTRHFEIDETSGVLTRRPFVAQCQGRIRAARAGAGQALVLVDMDYLKRINDAYGHETGDAALRHLAKVAHASLPDALIGRLGGDEFAFLLDICSVNEAVRAAGSFLSELQRTLYHDGRPLTLSASIGVAAIFDEGFSFAELMHRADLALYEAKNAGRGQALAFDPEMMKDHRQQRIMHRELRAAILLDQLKLVYQPIQAFDGSILGFEALVRWHHPVRGLVPPSEFIGIAEQSLLIDLLGEWVFRKACLDFRDRAPFEIGVNFSAVQFRRDDVVSMTQRVLEETGMDAARVVVEITESASLETSPDILRRVEELRSLGLRVALDDFGTGHSGFAYLREFPIDMLKIDRSFVARLGKSAADDVIVSAIAAIARSRGMAVVAEGVETEEQHLLARGAGCSHFQGYRLGRPAPLNELLAALKETDTAGAAQLSVA